jgi:hypothetical protein
LRLFCVCVFFLFFLLSPPHALPHGSALQAPSAAHHALPVSGQSSAVHIPLCRCVGCPLCKNLRAPNRTPHPSRCALPAALWAKSPLQRFSLASQQPVGCYGLPVLSRKGLCALVCF